MCVCLYNSECVGCDGGLRNKCHSLHPKLFKETSFPIWISFSTWQHLAESSN